MTILMFSGGYESVLCLNRLVDDGITPALFYFHVKRFSKNNEKRIRRLASLISPASPFYIFHSCMNYFIASFNYCHPYYYVRYRNIGPLKQFHPLEYGDPVVMGYTHLIYPYKKGKGHTPVQVEFIDFCKKANLPFQYPLWELTRAEIDKEVARLPDNIQSLIVSDTRSYAKRFIE